MSSVCFSLIACWFVSVTFCDSLRIRGKLYYKRHVHALFLFHFSPGLLSSLRPKSISFSFALTTPIHFGFAVQLEMVSSGSVTSFRGRVGSVCMLMWDLRSVWREEPGIWSQTPCNLGSIISPPAASVACLRNGWNASTCLDHERMGLDGALLTEACVPLPSSCLPKMLFHELRVDSKQQPGPQGALGLSPGVAPALLRDTEAIVPTSWTSWLDAPAPPVSRRDRTSSARWGTELSTGAQGPWDLRQCPALDAAGQNGALHLTQQSHSHGLAGP